MTRRVASGRGPQGYRLRHCRHCNSRWRQWRHPPSVPCHGTGPWSHGLEEPTRIRRIGSESGPAIGGPNHPAGTNQWAQPESGGEYPPQRTPPRSIWHGRTWALPTREAQGATASYGWRLTRPFAIPAGPRQATLRVRADSHPPHPSPELNWRPFAIPAGPRPVTLRASP